MVKARGDPAFNPLGKCGQPLMGAEERVVKFVSESSNALGSHGKAGISP